jgi:parvulin-like peptidyl-prolyl isomerase
MEMKTRLLVAPLVLALVASLAACGGGGGSQVVPANAVAVVDGTPITTAQFNAFFGQALAIVVQQGQPKPQPGTPQYTQMRDQVIAYLVQVAELTKQAPKEGVSMTDAEVTKFLTNLAKTNYGGSMKKLTAALKKQGLSMETARQEVYQNLLATKIRTKIISAAKVTTADERTYYNQNITQYSTPAQKKRSVEHILVKTKSLADKLVQQLKNGASFAALAKKYSKDPGTAAGGGTYMATDGQEVPAYDKAAFALKTGQLSAPVDATSSANGSFGWFIIKALGPVINTKAATTPFSTVQPTIEQTLLQQAQDQLWSQWLSDLTKQYEGKVSYKPGYAPPTTTALPTTT